MTFNRGTVRKYKQSPHLRLSDKERESVWNAIDKRIIEISPSTTKRSKMQHIRTSAAAVAAIVLFAGGLYTISKYRAHNERNVVSASNESNSTSQIPKQSHRVSIYEKYLSFTPLLPTYTEGYKLTNTLLARFVDAAPNSTFYTASFGFTGDGFDLSEGRPNQIHMTPHSYQVKENIVIGSGTHATLYKMLSGNTVIQFVENGIEYDLNTYSTSVSIPKLTKICSSISQPVTKQPDEVQVVDHSSKSASELRFNPVKPGEFHLPAGFSLYSQGAHVQLTPTLDQETYGLTYKNGSSTLAITQSLNGVTTYATGNYKSVKLRGQTIYFQTNHGKTTTMFTIPNSNIKVTITSSVSQAVEQQIAKSLLSHGMKK